jgi:ABC-2 type transport system ATP-binding protein
VTEPVISVKGLRKSYDGVEAVRGIDLEVGRGEVFAFLGPNGAGKTTTVEVLEGYRGRDGGEVDVLGEDPSDAPRAWRAQIGIVLQSCVQQKELTVRETLDMYAGYYPAPRDVTETIELAGLVEKADERAGRLSGGQQRRLDVALALVGDPGLLFLDEPTTGFDPSARRQAWETISGLRGLGKTIFLTTHYMEEAQALADRVAIISSGEIVAVGTPAAIGGRALAATEIRFQLPEGPVAELPLAIAGDAKVVNGTVSVRSERPVEALHALTTWALEHGHDLPDLEVRRPSLEDVYLELTK